MEELMGIGWASWLLAYLDSKQVCFGLVIANLAVLLSLGLFFLKRHDKDAAEISALTIKRDAHERARRAAAERLRELRGQPPQSAKLLREQLRAISLRR